MRADTHVWTGGAGNLRWSTSGNWQNGSVPSTNEAAPVIIEFPDGISGVVSNNIPGLIVDRLWMQGSGLAVVGAPGVSLTLRNTGDATINLYSAGTNQISASLPLVLAGTNRALGTGSLVLFSQISGDGGLNLEGNVRLAGVQANTYAGPTRLSYGTLTLSKYIFIINGGFGLVAVPGELNVSNGEVICAEDDNIADSSLVRLHSGTTLNLNGHNDTIGELVLDGGDVVTGNGILTLNGQVMAQDNSTISGKFSLGGLTRTFVLDANVRLDVWAHISNGGGGASLAGLIKNGFGVLALRTNNSYSGSTTVNGGTLELGHAMSLGNPMFGTTTVSATSTLALNDGVNVANESLALNGGLIRCAGIGAWVGPITLSGSCEARASYAGDELALTGVISGSGNLNHLGDGRLLLAGTNSNSYTGTTTVTSGSLHLAKSDGATAIVGPLIVGEHQLYGTNFLWLQEAEQIADTAQVTIESNGRVDFNNGVIETIGDLVMVGGRIYTGTGTLKMAGNLTVQPGLAPSIITGKLALGNAPRTFDLLDTNATALEISAVISGSAGAAVLKTGPGQMRFSGANTYPGVTTVAQGALIVGHNNALGKGIFFGPGNYTTVSAGASLVLDAVDVLDEYLSIAGHGVAGQGALNIQLGSSSWSGPVQIASDATINVPLFGALTLNNQVQGSSALAKTGGGTLTYGGTVANTLSGLTYVRGGTLMLNKPANVNAIAGPLTIGDGEGGLGADKVFLTLPEQIIDSAMVTVQSTGGLNLNGKAEMIGGLIGWGSVELGSGQLTVGANDSSTTFYGPMSGLSGKLTKIGNGTLTLTGTLTHTGETMVKGGTLRIDGTLQTSQTIATNGATLSGVGHLGLTKGYGGIISPGNSVGILETASLLLNNLGTVRVELNGPNPGTGYDQINVSGTVSLSGATLLPTFSAATGTNATFTIIVNDSSDPVGGTFQGLPQNANFWVNSRLFSISYTGGDGNDVVLTQLTTAVHPLITSIEKLANGSIKIDGHGIGFGFYQVEFSQDLETWQPLDIVSADDGGFIHYTDVDTINHSIGFFRFFAVGDSGIF